MSNKPKIYGSCPAGCKWETVHKEDFLKACSLVNLNAEDGRWYLEIGKQYKIFSENVAGVDYGFTLVYKYNDNGTETSYNFTIPNDDKYANYVVFRLLEASIDTGTTLTIVYEIAGIRYTETISGTSISLITENYLVVENADKVFIYNEDASYTLYGEKGEQGEKGDTGAKIVTTTLIGQDENGGNIYEQTFDDGSTAQFVAPKGDAGTGGGEAIEGAVRMVKYTFTNYADLYQKVRALNVATTTMEQYPVLVLLKINIASLSIMSETIDTITTNRSDPSNPTREWTSDNNSSNKNLKGEYYMNRIPNNRSFTHTYSTYDLESGYWYDRKYTNTLSMSEYNVRGVKHMTERETSKDHVKESTELFSITDKETLAQNCELITIELVV